MCDCQGCKDVAILTATQQDLSDTPIIQILLDVMDLRDEENKHE